ncbi:MAG: peptidoglycan-binding protein [Candidatus Pacebacteria bacterium]|nr:peptidoglycan-binding protein [Candidatus Paceibacterota bacterium]
MKKTIAAVSMFVLVLGGFGSLTINRAHASPSPVSTVYVDASVALSGGGTTPATAFKTIQEGVNAASSGATVSVAAGTYTENVTVPTSVTLAGAPGAKLVVMDGAASNGFSVTANNVTIQGFDIEGPANSSYVTYPWGSNISRGIVIGNGVTGFAITNNTIENLRNDILIDGRNTGSVTNNVIDNSKSGISVQYTDGAGITIAGNHQGTYGNDWGLNLHLNGYWEGSTVHSNPYPGGAASTAAQAVILADSSANSGWTVQDQAYTSSNRTAVTVSTTGTATAQGDPLGPINAIQNGVNAVVPGGTVNIVAGTYPTPLGIDLAKDVTIEGAGTASTILTTSSSGPSWIKVEGGTLTLKDLTMDGAGASINNAAVTYGKHGGAIEVHGSATVSGVAFKNITSAVSPYNTDAIVFYGEGANDVLNVTGSSFANIGRDGIYVGMAPAVATTRMNEITGNTYTGKGSGNWLDYFVTVNYGAKADISGNTISNNTGVASSDGSNSAGIAVWDDPDTQATLTGNTFNNNTDGVAVALINGGTADPTVTVGSNNVFNGGGTGVHIQNAGASGSPTVTVTSSTFSGNGEGISIDSGETASNSIVRGNAFLSEATSGVSNGGTGALVALRNWWGAANGPHDAISGDGSTPDMNASGTGSPVIGAVNYADWCDSATCKDVTPPVVTVTPVAGGMLHGTETFAINVTDNNPLDPAKNTKVWVYLYNNGGVQKHQGANVDLSGGTGTFTVDTTKLDNGSSSLDVGVVFDAAGNPSGRTDTYFKNYDIENATSGPSVPALLFPVNGDITPTNVFTFRWASSTASVSGPVTYEFHSSMNPAETGGVLTTGIWDSGTLPAPSILSSGAPDGTWYWQVRAIDAFGNKSAWSDVWAVTLDTVPPPALAACPAGTSPKFVETDTVNSNSYSSTAGANALASGQTYLLVASGTWQNGGTNIADPAYASVDNWTTYMQGYNIAPYSLGSNEFQLQVDGSFVNWGAFQPAHQYSRLYTGTGSPLGLMVFDGDSTGASATPNNSWYGDNSGNLAVNVYSCDSNEPLPVVYVTTDAATDVATADATLHGLNGSVDATGHSFWVSTSTFGTDSPNIPSGVHSTPDFGSISAGTTFSASLSSITTAGVPNNLPAITPSTTYYYAAWSLVNGVWHPGAIMSVTTAPAPYVTTNAADGLAYTSATVHGVNGPSAADNTSFWWGTSPAGPFTDGGNTTEFPAVGWSHDSGLGAAPVGGSFNETLTGLTPNTAYYYAAWSQIGGIWHPGEVMSFTTPALGSNAALSALDVSAGVLSPAFDPDTASYTDLLPHDMTIIPFVTATTADANATDTVVQATSTTGTATVAVTAQDGSSTKNYTVTFSLAPATTSILNVTVLVDNSTGGSATSSDFTVGLIAGHASTSSFPGSAAGTAVIIDPVAYNVNVSSLENYTMGISGNCNDSSGLPAGGSANCTITETYAGPVFHTASIGVGSGVGPAGGGAPSGPTGGSSGDNGTGGGQVLGASAFNFTVDLSLGSHGDDVTQLQQRLTDEGLYHGPITGYYGALTQAAVKLYQKKYGIPVTGSVGPLTRAQLNSVNDGQVQGATGSEADSLNAQIALLQAQLAALLQQLAALHQ